MQLYKAQTTLPLYIVRVNLTRSFVASRVSNKLVEEKKVHNNRGGKEGGQQIQGNIHKQE